MNVDRMQALRARIAELEPERVTMAAFGITLGSDPGSEEDIGIWDPGILAADCKTAGCLCGWATTLMLEKGVLVRTSDSRGAAEWLGLTDQVSTDLFFPLGMARLTKADVLATLDHLITTGEVQWPPI